MPSPDWWGSPPHQVAVTINVEWAHPEVLDDILRLLAERNLRATFFCTHAGIVVPHHERALHPNFRRQRNSLFEGRDPDELSRWTDEDFYRFVIRSTQAFCPEAVGVRSHCLFYDSTLLPIYRELGLQYESSYFLPLTPGLGPVWKGCDILALPIYYLDYWDLRNQATGFTLAGLHLERPGLKVVGFHPNIVFINAATLEQYLDSKAHYHDPERLRRLRHPGRGARTLFIELLDYLGSGHLAVSTLAEVNARCRESR